MMFSDDKAQVGGPFSPLCTDPAYRPARLHKSAQVRRLRHACDCGWPWTRPAVLSLFVTAVGLAVNRQLALANSPYRFFHGRRWP